MKERQIVRQGRRVALLTCGLLMSAWTLQSCKDDDILLTGQPDWLGNSIYERLSEGGNYKTVLRLVDELGQAEVLRHTGSKTLFAANDSAFDAWFGHNSWGVNSYEQLSQAQKKLLLNNAMINNAYLIELLSNVSGNPPKEGLCMRRETAVSIYDSVEIMKPEKMPNTEAWKEFKARGKSIPIFKDETAPPMIHFFPAFMKKNNITSNDLAILTNHQATDISEAWVNGKKVVERDLVCKNGYLHKVSGVIEASSNMAEIMHQHSQMSKWAELMDRFSAPYYHSAGTKNYNRLYSTEDSVYTLRYYSKRSYNGEKNEVTPKGEAVKATLSYDPGWNHYMYSNTMDYDLHYDAGAIIVPTNDALDYWWNHGGKDLQTEYGSWDSIPDATLAKLLNVNMLVNFTAAVPSKFGQVLNDAKEPLGITEADIDSCFMGCNGVVYMVNKVFTPAEYSSVVYPALAHESTMNVIYWAIEQLNFLPYLLSMDSQYSLLLPTNNSLKLYVDPSYYGQMNNQTEQEAPAIFEFYYDPTKSASERVRARRFSSTADADGNIEIGPRVEADVDLAVVKDRLSRLMEQLIIVGDVEDGHEYYKSKGGTLVRVSRTSDGRLAFSGGWQIEHNNKQVLVNSDEIYPKENGKAYQLNDGLPFSAQRSVYQTLKSREEFSEFSKLLSQESGLLSQAISTKQAIYNAGQKAQGNMNIRLLDNYNYTVYVPTNAAIQQLIQEGKLPTWDDYDALADEYKDEEQLKEAQTIVKNIIVDFIRYHIQDHSVAVNMAPEDGTYKNMFETMKRNPETGRFFPLQVDYSSNQMTLVDVMGNTRNVVKSEGLYNQICREYWWSGSNTTSKTTTKTFMASDAVVHQIDGALFFEEMVPWKDKLNNVGRK